MTRTVVVAIDPAKKPTGSTTRGPRGRLMPGSVAERLVSGAACPIAVAPHGYGRAFEFGDS